MSSFRIRPKFTIFSKRKMDDIIHDTRILLQERGNNIRGLAMQDHITLQIPPEERHFWSPQLSVILYDEINQTRLVGVYGPMPNVWIIFTFGYLGLSTLLVFILIIGLSQKNLGLESPVLWWAPVLCALLAGLYLFSQMGQKLGASQMFTLHHEMENILGEKIPIY